MFAWIFKHFSCKIPSQKRAQSGLVHSFLRRCWFISKVLRLFRKIFAFFASYSAIIFDGLALGWYDKIDDTIKKMETSINALVEARYQEEKLNYEIANGYRQPVKKLLI